MKKRRCIIDRDANLWKSKIWRFFFYKTPASNYHPPKKKRWPLLSIKSTSIPSNRLRASNVHRNLEPCSGRKGRRFLKSSKDVLNWHKVEPKSSEDFPMLAKRIRNISKVDPSILKTNWFLFLLRREKSTASVNRAIAQKLPQRSEKFAGNRAFMSWVFTG